MKVVIPVNQSDLGSTPDWDETKALALLNEVGLSEDIQNSFSKASRVRHSKITRDFALALDSFTLELGQVKVANSYSPHASATRALVSKLVETQQALNTFFERIP